MRTFRVLAVIVGCMTLLNMLTFFYFNVRETGIQTNVKNHEFLVVLSDNSSLSVLKTLCIGSIFKMYPDASVTLFAKQMDEEKRKEVEDLFATCSCSVRVEEYDVGKMLQDSPGRRFSISEAAKGPLWEVHEGDLARLLLLYHRGGTLVDPHILLTRKHHKLPSPTVANGSWFVKTDRLRSDFLASCLLHFVDSYRADKEAYNGVELLLRVASKSKEVNVLSDQSIFAFPKDEVDRRLFWSKYSSVDEDWKMLRQKRDLFGVSLYGPKFDFWETRAPKEASLLGLLVRTCTPPCVSMLEITSRMFQVKYLGKMKRKQETREEREEGTTWIVLSPHFDDAVLSVGGLLAKRAKRRGKSVVATFFTGASPMPVSMWDLAAGFNSSQQALHARVRENEHSLSLFASAQAINFGYLEMYYREQKDDLGKMRRQMTQDIVTLASTHASSKGRIWLIGPSLFDGANHVDHAVLHQAYMEACVVLSTLSNARFFLYEDFPYVSKFHKQSGVLGITHPRVRALQVALSEHELSQKERSIALHVSQVRAFMNVSKSDLAREALAFTRSRCNTLSLSNASAACEVIYELV